MTQTFMEAKGFAPVSPLILAPVLEIIDEEYEAWKREMGLDVELTDQQVIEIARYELQGC